MNHRDNTIPDVDWFAMRRRQVLAQFGSDEWVRRTRLAGLHLRAARAGRN